MHNDTTPPQYKLENFVIVRRELWDLVQDGHISSDEFLLLIVIHIKTNPHNGVCQTNYTSLAEELRGRFTANQINKMCLRLQKLRVIYFEKRRGKRGKFPIIPHRFVLASGKITNVYQITEEVKRRSEGGEHPIDLRKLAAHTAELYTKKGSYRQKSDWGNNHE